jgi:hypothetical protein
VKKEGMIPMAMAVYVNDPEMRGDPFFMRNADKMFTEKEDEAKHWWLTGFKLKMRNFNEKVNMMVVLKFDTAAEAKALYNERNGRRVEVFGQYVIIEW